MKIRTFLYTFVQGFRHIFRNKWFSLASIATIATCLFLLGIFYAVVANIQYIVRGAEEGVTVSAHLEEGLSDLRMQEIGDAIAMRTEVSQLIFITDEEAWELTKPIYGEAAEGFLKNPLEGMFVYRIHLSDVSTQDSLVTYLNSMDGIKKLNFSQTTADTLSGINTLIEYVSVGIIGILLAVSIFLISNTVTIGISVRKEEINIMKYIGATDFFVRAPFVLEGMLIGLFGAAIPLGVVYKVYEYMCISLVEQFGILSMSGLLKFLPVDEIFGFLTPVSLIVGVGIGFFGSVTTVRKHLRV